MLEYLNELIETGNFPLIVIFVALSGLVAYFGDIIGYRMGKRRLTLWNLRPRVTAKIITVITGITIAVMTLVLAAAASENVRIFLFHLDEKMHELTVLEEEAAKLKEQIEEYKQEVVELEQNNRVLTEANKNITDENTRIVEQNNILGQDNLKLKADNERLVSGNSRLESENRRLGEENKTLSDESAKLFAKVNELKNIIEIKKKNSLAFTANQVVDYVILGKDVDGSNLSQKFRELIERVIRMCENAGAKPRNFEEIWTESEGARKRLQEFIENIYMKQPEEQRKDLLVKVISPENVFKGERIDSFQFWFEQNVVRIPSGYYSTYFVDGGKSRYEIALSLEIFFGYMKDMLKMRGVVTELDIPTLTIYDLVNQVHSLKKKIKLYMTFDEDVYTVGEIKYSFRHEPFVESDSEVIQTDE